MTDSKHGKCKAINHDFTGKLNADGYCEWCESLMTDNEETRSYNEILAENKRLRSRRYQTAGQVTEVDVEFARFMFMRGYKFALGKIPGGVGTKDSIVRDAIEAWKAQQDND